MSRISKSRGGFTTILTLFVFALLTVLIVMPGLFNVADASIDRPRKSSDEDTGGIPRMWDIREEQKSEFTEKLTAFRRAAGTNAVEVADVRDGFVRGEEALKQRQPNTKIEYNTDIRIPEVISPKFDMNHIEFLTGPNGGSRVNSLRNFMKANNALIGVDPAEIDSLKVGADYTNPDGNLSYVRLEQEFNGIPVFRGEVNAGFTKDGRIIRIINNLAPGVDQSNVSMDFGDPTDALKIAAEHVGFELSKTELSRNDKASTGNRVMYGNEEWMPTAEKMYFPTEPGVAVPTWRILMWRGGAAYYVIVEPTSGTVLWHKNITDEQTQPATLQVYTNAPAGNAAYINVADSVMPLSPYISNPTNDPTVNAQGTYLARSNVSLIGNEGSLSFNNNGWITDNTNVTDGNATEAGSDIDTTNGIDATEAGDTACPGAGCRVFTSAWNPQPGSPAPGDDPLGTAPENIRARRGANIQMFYVMNLYHDELYKRGFNELARNFQASNFGRGGSEADRVSSEGQDQTTGSSCPSTPCTDNANFSTPADGSRGRMQMYIWSGHSPRRDGTGDADIIIHEVSHGTSNRIHGNGSGLGNQGGMMGEGWGDWYAHTLLAQPSDGVNGVHALSGYSTSLVGGLTGSYYYGIRRFPKAVISLTGGPARAGCNNAPCPHNPLTFKHINSNCDTTIGTAGNAITSAFPRNPVFGSGCSGVHSAGEIWSSALWEVRARMVTRLGFTAGTTRVLQAVTDGMKLSPISPTFLQGRDAVVAAAAALSFQGSSELAADVTDVREGFRVRGMGFSASVQSSTAVTEAFDFPNVTAVDPFTVVEAPSGADGDGFPEPGENLLLSVAVANPNTGGAITNVQVNVNGGSNVSYGTINDGQTVTNQIPYTVPVGAACGSMHQVTINVSSSVGAQTPIVKEFRLGAPVGGAAVTFSNNTLINLPNGQPGTTSGPASPYSSDIAVSGLSGNKVITLNLIGITHTFPGDLDFLLVGPGGQKFIFLSDSGGSGAVSNLNISLSDTAAAQPSTTQWAAGTFKPYNSGANDAFVAPAPAGPYSNAAPGASDTFASVFGSSGSGMNGTWSLFVVDDAGGDFGTISGGWSLTFEANDFACVTGSAVSISGRVVTSGGRGIANATVSLTDGVTTRVVRTSSFGYFVFSNLPASVQYTITPKQKRYTFTPQILTPASDVTGLTFTGT